MIIIFSIFRNVFQPKQPTKYGFATILFAKQAKLSLSLINYSHCCSSFPACSHDLGHLLIIYRKHILFASSYSAYFYHLRETSTTPSNKCTPNSSYHVSKINQTVCACNRIYYIRRVSVSCIYKLCALAFSLDLGLGRPHNNPH